MAVHEVALVDKDFYRLIQEGRLAMGPWAEYDVLKECVQPASLDLPLTTEAVLIQDKVLPCGVSVRDALKEVRLEAFSLPMSKGKLFLKGHTYVVYVGHMILPNHVRGALSPKSSIGRLDIMVRGIVDECGFYDTLESGYDGELWLEITPRSFNVRLRAGMCLSQLMLFEHSPTPSLPKELVASQLVAEEEEEEEQKAVCSPSPSPSLPPPLPPVAFYSKEGELLPIEKHYQHLVLHLDVSIGGYEALSTHQVVHTDSVGTLDPSLFFRRLESMGKHRSQEEEEEKVSRRYFTLEKDHFYILSTLERISIPPCWSAEMIPFSQHIGELRAHYAGFFDPGFGWHKDRFFAGTVAVLEVRPHETIRVYEGQPIALMTLFINKQEPHLHYGQRTNHYQYQQGPQLAKFFAPMSLNSLSPSDKVNTTKNR